MREITMDLYCRMELTGPSNGKDDSEPFVSPPSEEDQELKRAVDEYYQRINGKFFEIRRIQEYDEALEILMGNGDSDQGREELYERIQSLSLTVDLNDQVTTKMLRAYNTALGDYDRGCELSRIEELTNDRYELFQL